MASVTPAHIQGLLNQHIGAAGNIEAALLKDGVFRVSASGVEDHYIAKLTNDAELEALRMLEGAGITDVPELLASAEVDGAPLILIPEYEGTPCTWDDRVPDAATRTLASIHHRFSGVDCGLARTDEASLRALFEHNLGDLERFHSHHVREDLAIVRSAFEAFVAVARTLSSTLVHWDVHPLNVISTDDGAVIIDWGSARVGPAMIDLANVMAWDSPEMQVYLDAYESASGAVLDRVAAEVEYRWCKAITELKYLPYGNDEGWIEATERMARGARAYASSL